jgi:hypothetical protein
MPRQLPVGAADASGNADRGSPASYPLVARGRGPHGHEESYFQ